MMQQNYHNHKRYYAPHHFIFLPMMSALLALGIWKATHDKVHELEWILFSTVSFCILYLAIMLRQHYALGNQNRIVRLEFRLRHFELLGCRSNEVEKRLSFAQIAALRFCSDEVFEQLLNEATEKQLSADEIKKRIDSWQADDMRV